MENETLTLTIEDASKLLGISRGLGFTLAKEGRFPVKIIKCGRRLLVPRKPLLALLEGKQEQPSGNGGGNG